MLCEYLNFLLLGFVSVLKATSVEEKKVGRGCLEQLNQIDQKKEELYNLISGVRDDLRRPREERPAKQLFA